MPVFDLPSSLILGLMQILEHSRGIITIWLVSGGWLYLVRQIFFYLDVKLVNFIGYIYGYFDQILSGTMFNSDVLDAVFSNIYVFIGVIIFFRLMMIIIKYLINPDLVSDAKVGANALIKRVIIGACGILFIPTIFSLGMRLQSAIFNDMLIQQLIIPKDMVQTVKNNMSNGGKMIGTYVLAGFVSPSTSASSTIQNEYNQAISGFNPASISIGSGGFMGYKFDYEYFFLVSTVVLAFVFWQILKYVLDLLVRSFKLYIFQILAPVAMIEYMINGSENGVYKNWLSAVMSCYCMVFVRVMALWFVAFCTILMSGQMANYSNGSLLATNDNLLRALIIIALIGFMMDLPKIVGQIFGLDLEQESSATGLLKGIGSAFLSAGVAAGVGAFSIGKSGLGVAKNALGDKNDEHSLAHRLNNKYNNVKEKLGANKPNPLVDKMKDFAAVYKGGAGTGIISKPLSKLTSNAIDYGKGAVKAAKDDKFGKRVTGQLKNVGAHMMGATAITKSVLDGGKSAFDTDKSVSNKIKEEAAEAKTVEMQGNISSIAKNQDKIVKDVEAALNVTDRDVNGNPQTAELRVGTSGDIKADTKVSLDAQISGSTISPNGITLPSSGGTQVDISGSIDTSGKVSIGIDDKVMSGTESERRASAMRGATTYLTQEIEKAVDPHAGISTQYTQADRVVQDAAVRVSTEVFNGTPEQNVQNVRQTLVSMQTSGATNITSIGNDLTAGSPALQDIADAISKTLGVQSTPSMMGDITAALKTQGIADLSSVSFEDIMSAVSTTISSHHQAVQKDATVELKAKAKPLINRGKNNY